VAADYNRETGLVGDGSTKFLDSNRNNDDDPQDSKHISVYASTTATNKTSTSVSYLGDSSVSGSTHLSRLGTTGGLGLGSRLNSASGFGSTVQTPTAGFIGLNRSNASTYTARNGGTVESITRTSASPTGGNLLVFSGLDESNARIAFYSIGESLDLEKLDTRTTQLMNGISYAVSPDADAQTYIQAVETADNRKLEFHVAAAINAFVVGCKADGIWNAIKSSCILAGARTLAGALVPLVGAAPENGSVGSNQFVEADYDRKLGLQGSKASPFPLLSANRLSSDDPQDNHHCSVYVTEQGTTSGNNVIVYVVSGLDYTQLYWYNNTVLTRSREITSFVSPNISGLGATFLGISRSASTEFKTRYYGTTATTSSTSNPPSNYEYLLFGAGNTTNFNGRATFYSIGESLDLALLDNRVSTLMTDIGAAIP
jgi:hypothetical protein